MSLSIFSQEAATVRVGNPMDYRDLTSSVWIETDFPNNTGEHSRWTCDAAHQCQNAFPSNRGCGIQVTMLQIHQDPRAYPERAEIGEYNSPYDGHNVHSLLYIVRPPASGLTERINAFIVYLIHGSKSTMDPIQIDRKSNEQQRR